MNFLSLYKRKLLYNLKKKFNIDSANTEKSSLEELFIHYGTDKSNKGHGYTKFYEKHLNTYKNDKINILEIGSFSGSSASSFSKYFPLSKVFCLDINISKFKYRSKQINVFGLDVSNSNQVNKFHPFQTGLIYRIAQNTLYVAHLDGTLIIDDFKLESEDQKIMLGDRLYTPVALLEASLTQRIQYSPDGSVFRVKNRDYNNNVKQ